MQIFVPVARTIPQREHVSQAFFTWRIGWDMSFSKSVSGSGMDSTAAASCVTSAKTGEGTDSSCGWIGAPQLMQKATPIGISAQQFLQSCLVGSVNTDAPHVSHIFAARGRGAPQFEQG